MSRGGGSSGGSSSGGGGRGGGGSSSRGGSTASDDDRSSASAASASSRGGSSEGRSSGGFGTSGSGSRETGGSSGGSSSGGSAGSGAGASSSGSSGGGRGGGASSGSTASGGGGSRGGTPSGAFSAGGSSGRSSSAGGRSSSGVGTVGGGLGGAAGLSGSDIADKGGRVAGSFDSGRFGDPVSADKGGRVTGSQPAERGGRVSSEPAPDPGRFGGGSSTGRQSSGGGSFANGGSNRDRAGARAAAPVGNGLAAAAGLTAPSRSAREAESRSMSALAATTPSQVAERGGRVTAIDPARFGEPASPLAERGSRVTSRSSGRAAEDASMATLATMQPAPSSPNYGAGFARSGRAAEDASVAAMSRRSSPDYGSTFAGAARRAEDGSVSALAADRAAPIGARNYGLGLAAGVRRAEDQSLGALYDYDREVVGVPSAGKGWTQVERRDGTIETREGMRAGRNNNPGNLEYGEFARAKGAVGTDGRFAVFATPEQGRKAMGDLVFGPSYAERTIADAIERYAPKHENDSARYASTIAAAAGVPVTARVGSLNPDQRTAMIEEMTRVEGNRPYSSTTQVAGNARGTAPNGSRTTTDRIERTYLTAEVPAPTARPEAREDRSRLPGLAGVAPSLMPANAITSFDRSKLSADLNPILDGIAAVRPDAQIRSGYRDPARNERVGGARQSQHMQGRAVDIDMRGWSNEERLAVLDAAIASGARGIGIYNGGTSLHVDARPSGRAMWGGNPSGAYNGMSLAQAPEWSRASLAAWQGQPETGSRRAVEMAAAATTAPAALPAPRTIADRPVAVASARTVERFETTYLGTTPTARPETAAAKPERSMGDKVLAGAIDVGVGFIPGIGTAAGLYGLAAPMLGLPSVGDMVLAARDRNGFSPGRTPASLSGEGGPDVPLRRIEDLDEFDVAEAAAPPPPAPVSFAAKYLAPVDDGIARPTPMEKWGGIGQPSAGRYAL